MIDRSVEKKIMPRPDVASLVPVGYLGRYLVEAFHARGYRIRVLIRERKAERSNCQSFLYFRFSKLACLSMFRWSKLMKTLWKC
jgi:hypothetical protein